MINARRLLALDADGTTLDAAGQCFPGVRRLGQVRQLGFFVVLTTARPPWAVAMLTEALGRIDGISALQGSYATTSSGDPAASVVDGLFLEGISDRALAELLACLEPQTEVWLYTAQHWYVNGPSSAVRRESALVGRRPDYVGVAEPPGGAVLKVLIPNPRNASDAIRGVCARLRLLVSRSGAGYLEIVSGAALPAKGLEWLAARLNVHRNLTVAVGDSENDISMLRWAGLGITFRSANIVVRNGADLVLNDPADGGLFELFRALTGGLGTNA